MCLIRIPGCARRLRRGPHRP